MNAIIENFIESDELINNKKEMEDYVNSLLLKNVEIHKGDGCNLRTSGSNRPYFPSTDSIHGVNITM